MHCFVLQYVADAAGCAFNLNRMFLTNQFKTERKPNPNPIPPDDFYRLYALHMQSTAGDNATERPMWAERGGLDFEGRARWDAWTALKGLAADEARLRFVKLFWEFPVAVLYSDTRGALPGASVAAA